MPRLRPADVPVRVCLYGRVSMVGGREEIISPDVQLRAGTDGVTTRGWEVVEQIVELDATGRNFIRAGVHRAIEGVERGDWDVVGVYRYDRFGRNVRDSLVNIARVEAAGGEVVSWTEPFDAETAIGRYGRTNLLAIAELQSDLIGESWKAAHRNRVDHGLPHGGFAFLGYTYTAKHYSPDPATAPIVAELYRRYVAGEGMHRLADWLTALGLPRSAHGVGTFLETGFAAGLLHTKAGDHLPGAHEPIIDQTLWEAYRAERERRRSMHAPRLLTPVTAFSGLVFCDHCDRRLQNKGASAGRPVLGCPNRDCAGRPYVTVGRVEETALAWLGDYDADVAHRAAARAGAAAHRAAARAERDQLARQVARMDAALVNLAKAQADPGMAMPEAVYRRARADLLADRDAAQAELDKLGVEVRVAPPKRALVHGLLAEWDRLTNTERRAVLTPLLHVRVRRQDGRRSLVRVIPRWES